ncbi:uncharacterized protein EKO05_0007802 [Ascochyta rabiei]|nr:uncharacterized protein EKO05_0007802 [Ascochyta rabiei]UPX17449.1 hypothetical protein EKO05_0007802 [Ascochyta rabiei]
MKPDDEDDAPTYVLEDTNQSMTKEEYEAFVAKKESKGDDEPGNESDDKEQSKVGAKSKDKITEVGANAKKRKAAKIISDGQEESTDGLEDVKKSDTRTLKKPKKKAKAVKLTFGDEEEG